VAKTGREHERKLAKPAHPKLPREGANTQTQTASVTEAPAAVSATPTESAPETTTDHYKRLAEVLMAKARALASGLISSVSEPVPPPKVEPVLVADDYLTGIKTFAYSSGSLDEEGFSRNGIEGVAAKPQPTGQQ